MLPFLFSLPFSVYIYIRRMTVKQSYYIQYNECSISAIMYRLFLFLNNTDTTADKLFEIILVRKDL